MADIKITIQHENILYEPPIEEGVQIEWERSGTPGKLTFTTINVEGLNFTEGDQVCFYYDNKKVFVGYVFSKSRDKEQHIKVTCYDQIRYLKNKYTYVFEKKTATQIVKALCNDFGLQLGSMDNTSYVIPAIAEENKAAIDIILSVLEETLLNTGNMFVLYDDCGNLRLRNTANMMSTTLIYEDSAENFDYSSSIDGETYNSVVLYYKNDKEGIQLYTANSPSKIKEWGLLRYFEEVDTPTIGQNKANALLKLYNRKTRELKVSGAFGDVSVRGGTLIPVKLNLGDTNTNNYMLVEKVTHKFDKDHHTMDLTLEGAWEDKTTDMVSNTIGTLKKPTSTTNKNNSGTPSGASTETNVKQVLLEIISDGDVDDGNTYTVVFDNEGKSRVKVFYNTDTNLYCDKNSKASLAITPTKGYTFSTKIICGKVMTARTDNSQMVCTMSDHVCIVINWSKQITIKETKNHKKENASGTTGGF